MGDAAMTKGKYKARAANREVARDNEIIVEKVGEIAALRAELKETQRQLQHERHERGALVLARANELSVEQIASAHDQAIRQAAIYSENMRKIADWLAAYFRDQKYYPKGFIEMALPMLVPDSAERNKMVDALFENTEDWDWDKIPEQRASNRYLRRHSADNVSQGNTELQKKDSGVELLVRKGVLPEEALEVKLRKGLM